MLERGFEFAPGYRLQEFLGRGQFGQVWRASAPGGTAAAVKFIDLTEGSGQKEYLGIKRVKQIRQGHGMNAVQHRQSGQFRKLSEDLGCFFRFTIKSEYDSQIP